MKPDFSFLLRIAACGALALPLTGCSESDSDSSSAESKERDSAGNTPAANAAANMAAPGLQNVAAANAGSEFGGPPDDYEGGDFGTDEPGGGVSMGDSGHGGSGPDYGGMSMAGEPGGYGDGSSGPDYSGGGMSGEYEEGGYGPNSGNEGGNFGGPQNGAQPSGSSLPQDVSQWTDDQFVEAVAEKNEAVLTAIETRAEVSSGDPAFADLMAKVLDESAGVSSEPSGLGGAGGFGFGGLGGPGPGAGGKATPYQPKGSKPAGGASLNSTPEDRFQQEREGGRFQTAELRRGAAQTNAIDTVEAMLGESLLSFVAQARSEQAETAGLQAPGAVVGGGGGEHDAGTDTVPGMGRAASGGEHAGGGVAQGMIGAPGRGGAGTALGMQPGGPRYGAGSGYGENSGYGTGPSAGRSTPGNLTPEALLNSVTRALVKTNSPASWQLLQKIHSGEQATATAKQYSRAAVVAAVLEAENFDETTTRKILTAATTDAIQSPAENDRILKLVETASAQVSLHYFHLGQLQHAASGVRGGSPAGVGGPQGMSMGPGLSGPGDGLSMGPGSGPAGAMAMGPGPGGGLSMGEGMGGGDYGEGAYGEGDYGGGNNGFGPPGNGGPPGARPGAAGPPPPVNVSEALMPMLAEILWSPDAVKSVAEAIQSAGGFEQARPLLPLAATMPHDQVRHAVFGILKSQYQSGAGDLASMGFFQGMMTDPGMIPVLKSLPRERPSRQIGPNVGAQGGTPASTWTDGTKQAVLSLRDRLRKAADDTTLAYEGATPVRLHRGAIPQRSIRVTTGDEGFKALEGHAPSKTTYYYTSCTIAPTRTAELNSILDHYEKRAKAFRRLNANQTMLWMDGTRTSATGSRLSTDVVIEQLGASSRGGYGGGDYGGGPGAPGAYGGGPPGGGRGGNGQYQIEVIVVEVQDPTSVPAEDAVTLNP